MRVVHGLMIFGGFMRGWFYSFPFYRLRFNSLTYFVAHRTKNKPRSRDNCLSAFLFRNILVKQFVRRVKIIFREIQHDSPTLWCCAILLRRFDQSQASGGVDKNCENVFTVLEGICWRKSVDLILVWVKMADLCFTTLSEKDKSLWNFLSQRDLDSWPIVIC